MMHDQNENAFFIIDFASEKEWKEHIKNNPALIHFGSRYFKNIENIDEKLLYIN